MHKQTRAMEGLVGADIAPTDDSTPSQSTSENIKIESENSPMEGAVASVVPSDRDGAAEQTDQRALPEVELKYPGHSLPLACLRMQIDVFTAQVGAVSDLLATHNRLLSECAASDKPVALPAILARRLRPGMPKQPDHVLDDFELVLMSLLDANGTIRYANSLAEGT